MYGLKEAVVLAYQQLVKFLDRCGYYPEIGTSGLWSHRTRQTKFCVCVDDLGIKYFCKEDIDHLLQSLQNHYKLHIEREGRNYIGLTLDWNYDKEYVDVSIPKYIRKLLQRLGTKNLQDHSIDRMNIMSLNN